MERLAERQSIIVSNFKQQYQGRTSLSNSAWNDVSSSISLFHEACQTVLERLERKKILPPDTDLNALMKALFQNICQVLLQDTFPVCPQYKSNALQWLLEKFSVLSCTAGIEELSSKLQKEEEDSNDSNELLFDYKTYPIDCNLNITCMEEVNKMSNKDSTTGLITWQGSYGLLQYATNHFMPKCKVLELGSGAGLFGLSLLKTFYQDISSYIFSDIHPGVLNSIISNYQINFQPETLSSTDLKKWGMHGPPQILSDSLNQKQLDAKVRVLKLDWLDCNDESISSLDYDVIYGSDLTYVRDMLHPLACLLKRLLQGN